MRKAVFCANCFFITFLHSHRLATPTGRDQSPVSGETLSNGPSCDCQQRQVSKFQKVKSISTFSFVTSNLGILRSS